MLQLRNKNLGAMEVERVVGEGEEPDGKRAEAQEAKRRP